MYSDFASPLTFPVTELTNKLNNLGYQDMENRKDDLLKFLEVEQKD